MTASTSWDVWSTTAEVVVTDPAQLETAVALVKAHLAVVDDAANRFRDNSEIRLLPSHVSATFQRYLRAALDVAEFTDGSVDPTVGRALGALGYDRDIELVLTSPAGRRVTVGPVPGWRRVVLNGDRLSLPQGIELDFGATAKALAADEAAALVADQCGTGVLVSLGGDIATAGPSPEGGWGVTVDAAGAARVDVGLPAGNAIATSSTLGRRWRGRDFELHHIVNPETSLPTRGPWVSATVAAGSCLIANAGATGAIVKGSSALGWLNDKGLPARLVDAGGRVAYTAGWPAHLEAPAC